MKYDFKSSVFWTTTATTANDPNLRVTWSSRRQPRKKSANKMISVGLRYRFLSLRGLHLAHKKIFRFICIFFFISILTPVLPHPLNYPPIPLNLICAMFMITSKVKKRKNNQTPRPHKIRWILDDMMSAILFSKKKKCGRFIFLYVVFVYNHTNYRTWKPRKMFMIDPKIQVSPPRLKISYSIFNPL